MKNQTVPHNRTGVIFAELPVGAHFRWKSALGGQDEMVKISPTHLRNIRTGNEYAPNRSLHEFGTGDFVLSL